MQPEGFFQSASPPEPRRHPAPSRNIELKARCPDLDAARDHARRIGAQFAARLEQVDTYFNVSRGRLKLREIAGRGAELIGYHRPDAAEARGCDYRVIPLADPDALREMLEAALGLRVRVVKRREVWIWQNVRIHLDRVERLGTFIEFEAVLKPGETDASGHAKLQSLCEAFRIDASSIVPLSYADLLEGRDAPSA